MTLRDQRQNEFADNFINKGKRGILNLCARFGKIRTTILILQKLKIFNEILICYPDNKIKQSWIDDFEELDFPQDGIIYSTYLSLHKHIGKKFNIVILDELHTMSEAQIEACQQLFLTNNVILGLTGTLNKSSEQTLNMLLDLYVVAEYSIEQAIEENVIVDYQINVISVPLDTSILIQYSKKKKTEKKHYDDLTWVINKITRSGGDSMFMRLNRMRLIKNSLAKLNKTKQLLKQFENDRVLVFCGSIDVADKLGIPSFHSKSKDKDVFLEFSEGKSNHLAVIKIGNTGITYKNLNKVIINYFDSNAENLTQKINRCMAMEYNNPDKKAQIYIITSTENVEKKWLNKALTFFETNKIKYL